MKPLSFLTRALVLLAVAHLTACSTLPASTSTSTSTSTSKSTNASQGLVILVSIDGFRPDYLRKGDSPTLDALAAQGAHAPQGMRPSFPSLTFPNHYTLVTGRTPGRHGIVNNNMADPTIPNVAFTLGNRDAVTDPRWWDDAEPLWVTAEKQSTRTATFFWPGSEAPIHGVLPSDWRTYDKEIAATQRVDGVLSWLDRPPEQRPRFITLYFDAVDSAGHKFGPMGEPTRQAVRDTDAALARLVQGLRQRGLENVAQLVIVADHGMAPIAPERVVFIDDLLDTKLVDRFSTYGPLIGFNPLPGQDAAVRASLLTARKHVQCWPKADVPPRFDYSAHRRIPAYLCLAEPLWQLQTREGYAKNPANGGAHGYDPQDSHMAALFIAHGSAFQPGSTLATFDNVDVYPLLAHLMGIRPLANQGHLSTFDAVLRKTAP